MASPFPASTAAPGHGRIVVGLQPSGASALEALAFQYPLKLIAPGMRADPASGSALVFLLSYGGGLVDGDQVRVDVEVRPRARLSIVTQGTTKVFKAATTGPAAQVTRQTLHVRLAAGAALCLLPDPVQPFADSVYEQLQTVYMSEDSSLCLLDWVTQGRAARGENWSFTRWTGRNEVWSNTLTPRLLLRDAVKLAAAHLDGPPDHPDPSALRTAMHGLAVVGTLLLRGPLVDAAGRFFLDEFAALPRLGARGFHKETATTTADTATATWRDGRLLLEQSHGVLWSAAAVRGCVVVKFGACTVEAGRLWIGSMLQQQGAIAAIFGDQALMCVR